MIADAARTMPHTLRRVGTDDHTLAELGVLAGYDDDLAADITRMTNRHRDALLHIHPALERLLGSHFDRGGVLDLLAAAPTPAALAALGVDRIGELMTAGSPRLAKTLPAEIVAASGQQTVTVPGTDALAGSSPASPRNCDRSAANAPSWPRNLRPSWRPTLLPRS